MCFVWMESISVVCKQMLFGIWILNSMRNAICFRYAKRSWGFLSLVDSSSARMWESIFMHNEDDGTASHTRKGRFFIIVYFLFLHRRYEPKQKYCAWISMTLALWWRSESALQRPLSFVHVFYIAFIWVSTLWSFTSDVIGYWAFTLQIFAHRFHLRLFSWLRTK